MKIIGIGLVCNIMNLYMRKIAIFLTFLFLLSSCGPQPVDTTTEYYIQNNSGQNVVFVNETSYAKDSIAMNNGDVFKVRNKIGFYAEIRLYFNDAPVLQLDGSNFGSYEVFVSVYDILDICTITETHYNLAQEGKKDEK